MTTTARSPALGISQADFDNFKPMNGFILVRRDEQERNVGAIVLVEKSDDSLRKDCSWATVIRTGGLERATKVCRYEPNKQPYATDRLIPLDVKAGDRVFIDKYAGHDIEIKETGERFVLVGDQEVFIKRTVEGDD